MRPNNSFKPTPHRGVGHVLYATLARVRHPAAGRLNSGVRPLIVTQPDLPDFDYEAVLASLTESDRHYLLEAYGVPLDATSVDSTYLQFLVTIRRIKQLEEDAISKLSRPRTTNNDTPSTGGC